MRGYRRDEACPGPCFQFVRYRVQMYILDTYHSKFTYPPLLIRRRSEEVVNRTLTTERINLESPLEEVFML